MVKFQSRTECAEYLVAELPQIPRQLIDELVAFHSVEEWPSPPPGAAAFMMPVTRWIVRDDDLKLLEALIDGCKAGAAAGFFMPSVAATAVTTSTTGIVTALLKLGRQAWRKGRRLTPLQFAVLGAIKSRRDGLAEPEVLPQVDLMTGRVNDPGEVDAAVRSEEHTSELQSQSNLVCRLL